MAACTHFDPMEIVCLVDGRGRDCARRRLADFGTGAAPQHFHGVSDGGAVRGR
jgi:hypothetical protein